MSQLNTKTKKPNNKTTDSTTRKQKSVPKKNITAKQQVLAYKVPECSLHYGAALANPFDAPAGVCIPAELLPLPSQKTKTFVRGRFAVGTGGLGFITVTPNLASDAVCARYTTATSVGTSVSLLSAFTNTSSTMCGQLPFNASYISGAVAGRIAACGVRIFYAGQAMQKGGNAICYEEPDGRDMQAGSYDSIASSPYAQCIRMDKSTASDWDCACCYSGPIAPSNIEFSNTANTLGNNIFGILINGTAGDIYEYEIYQHSEFIGTAAVGKTASHSDPQSCAKVLQAAKAITADGPLSPAKEPTLWEKFKEGLIESLPKLINAGIGVGRMMMGDATGAPQILGSFAQMLPAPKVAPRVPAIGWK